MDVNNTFEYFLCLTRSWEDEEVLSHINGNFVSKYNEELLRIYGGEVIKVEEADEDDVDLDTYLNNNLSIQSILQEVPKPWQCQHCTKQFKRKQALERHTRTHTGEKPYLCKHCKKTFSESSSLTRHMRSHTGEKPYSCEHCEKKFGRNGDLTRHMITHTGEKPYSCKYCQKKFSQSSSLKTHMRTHTD